MKYTGISRSIWKQVFMETPEAVRVRDMEQSEAIGHLPLNQRREQASSRTPEPEPGHTATGLLPQTDNPSLK